MFCQVEAAALILLREVMIEAAAILALLADRAPQQYAAEPDRFAVIAVATERAVKAALPRWHRPEKLLLAALLTAALRESGFRKDIHSGELRGKAGEICLVQIHPRNPVWRTVGAPSFDALGGVDLQSTTYCLTAGALSLARAASYCGARHYRKNWAQAMWTLYHYGSKCWLSPHAYPRTATMWRLYNCSPVPTDEYMNLVRSVLEVDASDDIVQNR